MGRLEDYVAALEAQVAALTEQVAQQQVQIDTLTAQNVALTDEVAALQAEIVNLTEVNPTLQAQLDECKKQNAALLLIPRPFPVQGEVLADGTERAPGAIPQAIGQTSKRPV